MSRETQIDKLKADLAAGRVVTIVGTGVSVAACGNQEVDGFKVATWTGLLGHGLHYCRQIGAVDDDDVEILSMQLRKGKTDILINAAETISQRMMQKSPGTFRGWLKDTVGKLELKPGNRDLAEAVAALPGVLATLNYDHLLEAVSHRHAVTWMKHDDVQDVLTRKVTDAILHLHGYYKEPESVVLGLSSYLAVKDQPHAKAVLNLFALDRTLLFIGCGDTVLDPNFTRLIEWGKEALKDVAPRHWLLCRESEIADFQNKLAGAPWLQPLSYGAGYDDLLPFVRSLAPSSSTPPRPHPVVAPPPLLPTLNLEGYRKAMLQRCGHLKLEQLEATTHDIPRPLMLTGMFIPQSARECAEFMPRVFELPKELQRGLRADGNLEGQEMDEEMLDRHRREYLDQTPRSVLEIAADAACTRLVVLGDPGSGKSSLLQYLLLQWAENTVSDTGDQPLPILIELRDFARLRQERQADNFLDYLHQGSCVRFHLDRAQLVDWLQSRPCLVFFDGLDEIFDAVLRAEISTAIHRFADSYPLSRIIVTSRIIGYQHQTWRDEKFRQVMLQDLDEDQIGDFLRRWHRAAYEDRDKGQAREALLARAIRDSAAIRQLAGNPLLLTMMAILNRTQELPRDRARLYEKCSELLLHQWKAEEALQADPDLKGARLDFADKRTLLLRVAHALQNSPSSLAGNLITESRLEATLTEGLQSIPGVRPDRAARALITQLRGRNFMLSSVGGQSYAFVHRTFLEYFCALEIRERFETTQTLSLEELKTEIFGHWPEETWHEVLCLLAGMLAPRFVREILEWLLMQKDSANSCLHIFLAARCVGEVRDREALGPVESGVITLTQSLVDFELPYYSSNLDEVASVSAIKAKAVILVSAIWNDTESAVHWLLSVAHSDSHHKLFAISLQELCRKAKNNPDVHPFLLSIASSSHHPYMRLGAIRELARGWKGDHETLLLLSSTASSDPSPEVRVGALQELTNGLKNDRQTQLLLHNLASPNQDHDVREEAIRQLARKWKSHPDTLVLLSSLALADLDYGIRVIALQELARGWSGHRDTHALVYSLTSIQEMRLAAARELVTGWKDHPDTHPLIFSLASFSQERLERMEMIHLLTRWWKHHSDTFTLLLSITSSEDIDNEVRLSAALELSRGWKDLPKARHYLYKIASSDQNQEIRRMAIEELGRRWNDDVSIVGLFLDLATENPHFDVRIRAAQQLVRWWRDSPETWSCLRSLVAKDPDPYVRSGAARELAREWGANPEIRALLISLAHADPAHEARLSAVREISREWGATAEAQSLLFSIARDDMHLEIRYQATLELACRLKGNTEVRKLFVSFAFCLEDKSCRRKAIHDLAHRWKLHPDTRPLLFSIACLVSRALNSLKN